MIIADWQYLKPKNPKAGKMAGPEQKKYKTEEEQNPDKYEWKQNYEILVWNPANTDIINGNTVMILER